MLEIFLKGERDSSLKMSAPQLEKLMKSKYKIELRLKATQIKGYFTNLAKDKIKAQLLYDKLLNHQKNGRQDEEEDDYLGEIEESEYNQLVDDPEAEGE